MSRRRVLLLSAGTLFGITLVLGLLLGWRAVQVNTALQDTVRDAETLRTALESGEQSDVDDALTSLQSSASEARELTNGTIWGLGTWVPIVGDDARGVRTVTRVLADLSGDGLPPLAEVATDLDALVPDGGRVDPQVVTELQQPVGMAAAALEKAKSDLAAEDPAGFVGRLRTEYRRLVSIVDEAETAVDAADVAVGMLPDLLGQEGRREYLLVFQNNAELRATGGLPGAMALITAHDGAIELVRQETGSGWPEKDTPVIPLTKDEREVYSDKLGTFMQDANFTPDWPRAAELIEARWAERYPEDELDGVLTIDTVALSYLLEATGPLEVGGYTLTSANAVDVLLNQVYFDIEDYRLQDAFFAEVARTVFDAVAGGQVERPRELLRALVRAGQQGRLYAVLSDAEEQAQLVGRRIAGTSSGPGLEAGTVDVSLLDGTASKMSYYLDYRVSAAVTSCSADWTKARIRASLVSNPPEDVSSLPVSIQGGVNNGTKPGNQLVQVRLMTPEGSKITGFTIRGKKYGPRQLYLDERQVSTAYLLMEPGKPADIEWTLRLDGGWSSMPVRVTPGIDPIDYSARLLRRC